MWVPVVVVVVVVVVVEGSRQCAFWVVEIFLSTPNKICALWLKYLVFVTFGVCAFFVFILHYCCMCTLSFWQKIESKTKTLFFVVVPLHYCCCAYTRLGQTDGQTDRQRDNKLCGSQ